MKIFLISALLFLLICTSQSISQSNSPNPNAWAVYSGAVRTVAAYGDYVYMGGDFKYVGPKTGCLVKVSANTILVDNAFPKVEGNVVTAVGDGNGGWYVGGNFNSIGGVTRNNIARINSDGTVHPWNPNSNLIVNQIVLSGNDIFVSGGFSFIGGQSRTHIAKLNKIQRVPLIFYGISPLLVLVSKASVTNNKRKLVVFRIKSFDFI